MQTATIQEIQTDLDMSRYVSTMWTIIEEAYDAGHNHLADRLVPVYEKVARAASLPAWAAGENTWEEARELVVNTWNHTFSPAWDTINDAL